MPRKKAKSKIRCFCGAKLRPRDKHCARCYRVTRTGMAAAMRKAAAEMPGPAFAGKAAGRAAVAWCPSGHANRPGGNCCTTCQALMPGVAVPPMAMIGKSALATEYWRRQYAGSHDPADRELYQRLLYGEGTSS